MFVEMHLFNPFFAAGSKLELKNRILKSASQQTFGPSYFDRTLEEFCQDLLVWQNPNQIRWKADGTLITLLSVLFY